MNPMDLENLEINYWLFCLIVDVDAMCKQVRGEQDVCYAKEAGKPAQLKFWKQLHPLMQRVD